MSYQDELKHHLAEFKRSQLGIAEPGLFRFRGRNLEYHHILPTAHASANLLLEAKPAAKAFLAANPRKRHRYFHHLNSSQAFAFNLFFPYFSGDSKSSSVLLHALGQGGILDKWEAEAIPVPDEGTNVDMIWETSDGVLTFCEVKLSEADFGTADNDASHHVKLRDIYSEVLCHHLEPSRLKPQAFFAAYQFNRNVWHMARKDGSRLVFLLPRSNIRLWKMLQALLLGVAPITRQRISAIAIEDVIDRLMANSESPESLRDYPSKLKRKYIPTSE